ncbi:hypothetical protein L2E82_39717 [Cichorium intybus]|uniref:Uncharacterized protein n=1 Tax=Cichorium intybus TaxID=13427 RepID=A0ACB9AJB1_CICIN|nr:hypothetical protein L2E82_39717 [Cichorium intybus]
MISPPVSVRPPQLSSPFLGTAPFPHELLTSSSHCLLPLNHRYPTLKCRLAKTKDSSSPNLESLVREPHKYFDQAIITIRAGDGGHGATLTMPNSKPPSKSLTKQEKEKARIRGSYKRDFDGSLILPMGGHGGDVVIYADEAKDSLLEFHKKGRYNAKRGGNVDTMGGLSSQLRNGLASPTGILLIVPPATCSDRHPPYSPSGNFYGESS